MLQAADDLSMLLSLSLSCVSADVFVFVFAFVSARMWRMHVFARVRIRRREQGRPKYNPYPTPLAYTDWVATQSKPARPFTSCLYACASRIVIVSTFVTTGMMGTSLPSSSM